MRTVKKTSTKKYQAGGTKPKDVKGPSVSKSVKKSGKIMGKMAESTGKPVTGKTGYIPPKKKGGSTKKK